MGMIAGAPGVFPVGGPHTGTPAAYVRHGHQPTVVRRLLLWNGIVFHVWESLCFQNAIWHAFMLVAATCHYGAVMDCMVLARG